MLAIEIKMSRENYLVALELLGSGIFTWYEPMSPAVLPLPRYRRRNASGGHD